MGRAGEAGWLTAGFAAGALGAYALLVEPASPQVEEEPLPIPDLPAAWEGARILHATDLHYGNPRSDQLFSWLTATIRDLSPDLVLITGDFVVRSGSEVAGCLRHLEQISAPRGVVAVLGDHDYHPVLKEPFPPVLWMLRETGVEVLRNRGLELAGGLKLAGVDPQTRKINHADLPRALADLGSSPHLLLAHSPDTVISASRLGVPLQLSGHTHGGQVVVPGYGPPITHSHTGRRHASGWSRFQSTDLYTGRGLSSHLSLRFYCRPHVTLFTAVRQRGATPG